MFLTSWKNMAFLLRLSLQNQWKDYYLLTLGFRKWSAEQELRDGIVDGARFVFRALDNLSIRTSVQL